jgi:uncharacterized repeat protein (TIGR01451 family)
MKLINKIKKNARKSSKLLAFYMAIGSMLLNMVTPFLLSYSYVAYAEDITVPVTEEVTVVEEPKESPTEETSSDTQSSQESSDPSSETQATQEVATEEPQASETSTNNEVTQESVIEETTPIETPVEEPVIETITDPATSEPQGDILEDGVSDYRPEADVTEPINETTTDTTDASDPVVEVVTPVVETTLAEETVEAPKVIEQECLTDGQTITDSTKEEWNIDSANGYAETRDKVKLGVKYVFPEDDKVTVSFSCLPKNDEDRSILKIQKIKVSDLNLPEGVSTSAEFAYDITTDMENGNFKYDVTLPKPEGTDAKVSYIEKSIDEAMGSELTTEEVKNVEENKIEQNTEGSDIKVGDLDHFTIFFTQSNGTVIVAPNVYLQGETVNVKADNLSSSSYYRLFLVPPSASEFAIGSCHKGDGDNTISASYDLVLQNVNTPGTWTARLYRFSNSGCSSNKTSVQTPWPNFTVTAVSPNLTITKVNNVSGSVVVNTPFKWTLTITNSGNANAVFDDKNILTDNLPSSGVTYSSTILVSSAGGAAGSLDCSISSNTLNCHDNHGGGTVVIPSGGSFSIEITATPATVGTLENPKSGGVCKVDQDNAVTESNENDNNCLKNSVTVTSVTNPTLSQSCGLDIALVFDGSGSIGDTAYDQMQSAFVDFVNAFLPGTPTEMGIVEFASGSVLRQGFTNNKTTLINEINENRVQPGGQSTNWKDGLLTAHNIFPNRANPDLIVLASDGNPNKPNDSTALSDAVTQANHIKTDGIRIITIGIGNQLNPDNLKAISSADAYYSSDFDELANTMAQLADELCGRTVTVTKLIDADGDLLTTNDRTAAQGWEFNIGGQSGKITDSSGKTPAVTLATGSNYNVTETVKSDYGLISANCTGADDNGTQDLQNSKISGIHIADGNIVSCTFINTRSKTDLKMTKTDSPDPVINGGTLTYTLTVENLTAVNAANVIITDTLPTGFAPTNITPSVGSCSDTTAPGIQCELGTLAGNASATVTIVGTVSTGNNTISNSASVSTDTPEISTTNNSDSEDTAVTQKGSITAHKFADFDKNGVQDVGEPNVRYFEMSLYNGNDCVGSPVSQQNTDIDGNAVFTDLSYGNYSVKETIPPAGLPGTGWWTNISPVCQNVQIDGSDEQVGFANFKVQEFTVCKSNDMNGDGIWQREDSKLPGWTVYLTGPENLSAVTGNDGCVRIPINIYGSYVVTEDLKPGWVQTFPSQPQTGYVSYSTSVGLQLFNFKLGSISGQKFEDVDGDGVKDTGESGLENWTIELDKNADGTVDATTVTNSDGNYQFSDLGAGVYRVREQSRIGWTQKTLNPLDITIQSGSVITNVDFGNQHSMKISGYKYNDIDGDGEKDSNELGLPGWIISLCKIDEQSGALEICSPVGQDTTDETGYYEFSNLEAGSYKVTEENKDYYKQTYPANGYHEVNSMGDDYPSVNFMNQPVIPELLISKEVSGGAQNPGGSVTFTIRVRALGSPVFDVNVFDLPSKGFTPRGGTFGAISNDHGSLSVNPVYASPGKWELGDLEVGEEITLTYTADISSDIDAGIYKDLAWTTGTDSWKGVVVGESEDPGKVNDIFVGQQVKVNIENEPEKAKADIKTTEQVEEVLGASDTRLPATGISPSILNTILSAFALGGLLLMIGGFSKLMKKRKGLFSVVAILMFGVLSMGQAKAAENIVVRMEDPKSPAIETFSITFVVMDLVGGRDISYDCYNNTPSDSGTYNIFDYGTIKTSGGNSAVCDVTDSVLNDNGDYSFYVVVKEEESEDEAPSNIALVTYDSEGPGKPKYIEKDKKSDCKNEITLKTSNDGGETSYVEVYKDTDKEFTVGDGNRIKTITLGSDEKYSFNDEFFGSDCGKKYYYAVRAFDTSGNASSVRSEEITETTTKTIEGSTEETQGALSSEGQVLGTGGSADGVKVVLEGSSTGSEEEGSVLGEETTESTQGGIGGVLKTASSKWWVWVLGIVVLLVIGNGIRKKGNGK